MAGVCKYRLEMKNYYEILGVTRTDTEDEIRKSYRKLAMRYHPDRNPGDQAAEEKFKNIAEAYGVLTDPEKRREYDSFRKGGGRFRNGQGHQGFSYSQEDILKDLFQDPRFQHMFSGLLREFQRSGFQHNSQFIKKSFFGGKGSIFLGGIFLFGSLAKPLLSGKGSVLKSVGSAVGTLFGRKRRSVRNSRQASTYLSDLNTTYHTPLTTRELAEGKIVEILVYAEDGEQTLKVKIPPGSKDGQKLRLRGKGRSGLHARGDLYLHLVQKNF